MGNKYAHEIIELILNELKGRGGFDGWWGNIDDDIQEEIQHELEIIVKEYHRPGCNYCLGDSWEVE